MAAHAMQPYDHTRDTTDGYALSNLVVVAIPQPGRLAVIRNILWRHADGRERKECIVGPDLSRPFNGNMRYQMAPLAQFNLSANHTVGPDCARRRDFGARVDNCRG